MLAPAALPLRYRLFNLRWGAPAGRFLCKAVPRKRRITRWAAPLVGCFAYQINNTTRAFEYPWVFEALNLDRGLRVLEIGGSLAGLQFVLDRVGCDVVNVDPGDESFTWFPVTHETMARLNRVLGTAVTLKHCYLDQAGFPDASFDRVVSVSVFEHIPEALIAGVMAEVRRVLKPGGLLVMTVDLFLDVQPFAAAESNVYGRNVSVKSMVEASGLELVHGNRAELFGYPEFDPESVARRRASLLVGDYPAMVQTLVLRRTAGA
jgi:SAM-dependent methyltransferase